MNRKIEKLNGRDMINIGIYAAIYFVIAMALAFTGLIPIMLILLSTLYGIVGGIPFMLFLTKVKKPGILAELIYCSGDYQSMKAAVLTAGFFPMWACGNFW